MKEKIDPKEWAEEFKAFLSAPEAKPSRDVQDEIFRVVHQDLNPNIWSVFGKLGGIHFFAGGLSLLLCSQFGVGRGDKMEHLFMNYGALACMVICGALFLGLTSVAAGFILSTEELRKIRKTCYAPIVMLGIASLMVFFFFGAEIVMSLALFWLIGAMIAGALLTETSLLIRGRRFSIGNG